MENLVSNSNVHELEKFSYWMVLYKTDTKDFLNSIKYMGEQKEIDEVLITVEQDNPDFKIVLIGEGSLPPKIFRTLKYVTL